MQAEAFLDWLVELEPTWYTAVPTMRACVLDELARRSPGALAHCLRFARSCSAPLPARLATALETALGVPVIEAHGMTEATHQMASSPLPPLRRKAGSVGIATSTEIAILGENGRPVPVGEPGEIVVRGETVITA